MLRDHCSLYNEALQERRDASRHVSMTMVHGMQSAQLKDIRAFDPERWSFSSQRATISSPGSGCIASRGDTTRPTSRRGPRACRLCPDNSR
jgi:hypothetical protein